MIRIDTYRQLSDKYDEAVRKLSAQHRQIGIWRLTAAVCVILGIYLIIKFETFIFMVIIILAILAFIFIVKWHDRIGKEKKIKNALHQINLDEIEFLSNKSIPFNNGHQYIEHQHAYAFDLDLFGDRSLFHHLNRTGTFIGRNTLAHSLMHPLNDEDIQHQQEAIREISGMLDWRQKLKALAIIHPDDSSILDYLATWSQEIRRIPKLIWITSHILPVLFALALVLLIIFKEPIYFNLLAILLIANLTIFGSEFKSFKKELSDISEIDKIVQKYASILQHIEAHSFGSTTLINAKKELLTEKYSAANAMRELAEILAKIDTVNNAMAVLFLSGSSQYHLFKLNALYEWKRKYGQNILQWFNLIGNIEMLSSYGNLFFNNPNFIFPEINHDFDLAFEDLGHPLIREDVRVTNDISFEDQPFIILTGSNMSGKSTFLRSLGISIVLTRAGAPICASRAVVHPMDVFVSMRLSDSLADSESFFYAEVKRLQQIMQHLTNHRAFILLDEILRGTNSDDKRKGTIEVIKKMVGKKAIGAIATHDLEVCKIVDLYPSYLVNRCFEVEIINNDLHFDYKLRPGICQNQSASFLMKKMQII